MKNWFYILITMFLLTLNSAVSFAYESPVARIVGGVVVESGDFQFQAGLREFDGVTYTNVFCGGVLINSKWVLTAAHCIQHYASDAVAATKVKVMLDTYVTTFDASKLHGLTSATTHPAYNSTTYNNDIALLELSAPVATSTINYMSTTGRLCYNSGDTAVVSGWGRTSFAGAQSTTLLHIDLPIISKAVCEIFWGLGRITDGMVCAGGASGEDSCSGDSGGPLFVLDYLNRAALIGLVSFGPAGDCGGAGEYGVYTKVAEYITWIEAQTGVAMTPCYAGYDPINYDARDTDDSIIISGGGGGGGGCSAAGEGSPFGLILMGLMSGAYLYRRKRA